MKYKSLLFVISFIAFGSCTAMISKNESGLGSEGNENNETVDNPLYS